VHTSRAGHWHIDVPTIVRITESVCSANATAIRRTSGKHASGKCSFRARWTAMAGVSARSESACATQASMESAVASSRRTAAPSATWDCASMERVDVSMDIPGRHALHHPCRSLQSPHQAYYRRHWWAGPLGGREKSKPPNVKMHRGLFYYEGFIRIVTA